MSQKLKKHVSLLKREGLGLIVIDVQERMLPAVFESQRVQKNVEILVEGFKVLDIPIIVTEQYPKGLGLTIPELQTKLPAYDPFEKVTFNCFDEGNGTFLDLLRSKKFKALLICGVEAHVCVVQTVLDALANNFGVHVAVDAISSRNKLNWHYAIVRMREAGAILTTTESALFELLVQAKTPEFKKISALVK
ncbi:MAG: hydrolase [Candidatus Hodarchaeota archaeon]